MPRKIEFDVGAVRMSIMFEFWKKGYDGTSLSDLEAAASVVRTSLYNYFGTKPDMFLDSLKLYHEIMEQQIDEAITGRGTAALAEVVMAQVNAEDMDEGQPLGCLMVNAATQFDALDERHRATVRSYRQMLVSKARDALDREKALKKCGCTLDTAAAADFLICFVWGALAAQCLGTRTAATASFAAVLQKSIDGWFSD